mmetsp:Transcript_1415/g.5801  ORF Transcript_1415/g.5801 Transcript_1415/m.5801 type:complete len:268 (-) Transcript_1415:509-1312(-)
MPGQPLPVRLVAQGEAHHDDGAVPPEQPERAGVCGDVQRVPARAGAREGVAVRDVPGLRHLRGVQDLGGPRARVGAQRAEAQRCGWRHDGGGQARPPGADSAHDGTPGARDDVQGGQLRLAQLHQGEAPVQTRDDVHGEGWRRVPVVPQDVDAAASAQQGVQGDQLPGASVQGSQRVPQEGDGADRGAQARAVPHVHQPAERRDAPLTGWKPLTKDNSSSSSSNNNNNNRNIGRRRRRGGNRTRRGARRGGKKITEGESWRRRVRRA